jgi:proton-dependent oligopeptide transporter, POT family
VHSRIARTVLSQGAPVAERHPAALPMLFFTEMWERFSYYGMRALLVLYLVNALEYPRADALALYGTYTALVYLTPIVGGYIADRYLGYRKAILIGGIVMAMGHFAMAFPALLHLALGLLIIGNGFFKPNISTLLGTLYGEHDTRRDSGFTIFYMGINLGALLSPLIAGTLGETIGWHWGFASAGVGMLFAVSQFVVSQHKLGAAGLPAGKTTIDARDWLEVLVISALAIPLVYAVRGGWHAIVPAWDSVATGMKVSVAVAAFVAFLAWQRRSCTRSEWHRVLAIVIIGVFVIFFWMGFEQAGGTMNLFADKLTDRSVLGWEMPASYFQGVNPLLIVLLGPLFSLLWTRWDQSRFALSTPAKMGLGMLILGAGFVILAVAQGRADTFGKVGPQWLLCVYLLHTIGELCLSPIGLSMVTRIAPVRLAALMMGVWFAASAIANYLAGILESLLADSGIPLYWFLVGSSVGAGILLLLLSPMLVRLMHGRE